MPKLIFDLTLDTYSIDKLIILMEDHFDRVEPPKALAHFLDELKTGADWLRYCNHINSREVLFKLKLLHSGVHTNAPHIQDQRSRT